jgi:hypothetical protein
MPRGFIAAVLGVLASSSLALGQMPDTPDSSPQIAPIPVAPGDGPPSQFDEDTLFEHAPLFTFDADYVLWTIPNHQARVPVGAASAGSVVNFTGVDTLGDEHLDRRIESGARFAVGGWLTEPTPWVPGGQLPCLGIEARGFFVGQRSVSFTDGQSSNLVRPFFDLNNAQPSAVIVAAPGVASGNISGTAKENLYGAEANVWKTLHFDYTSFVCSVEGMVGLRYLDLNETIDLNRFSSFISNPPGLPPGFSLAGSTISEQESFATRNQFWGGQVGIRGRLFFEKLIMTGAFQLGLGNTNEEITILGSQTRTFPGGATVVSPGALLALPSNIGRFHENKFTQVPQFDANVACPVTSYLTVSLGFTSLYWSRVVKPADQVDRVVDITQIPNFPGAVTATPTGQARPAVPFNQSTLWLFGTVINAELRW